MRLLSHPSNYFSYRGFFFQAGFYYPLFFFQLDSIKHGINITFSFYSVGSSVIQEILATDDITSL